MTRHLQMHTKMADGPEVISALFPVCVLSFPHYDLHVCLFVRRVFWFWMCLPIAVAPCSLRVLFAAPFKERLKAHLSARHCNFIQNPHSLCIFKQPGKKTWQSCVPSSRVNPWVAFLAKWGCLLRLHTFLPALAGPSGDPGWRREGQVIVFLCFC